MHFPCIIACLFIILRQTISFRSSQASVRTLCRRGATGRPLDYATGWPQKFPAKDHCSRCGLCETTFVSRVKDACALLPETGMSRMHELEVKVHGRSRNTDHAMDTADEGRFGVLHEEIKLVKGVGMNDSQWTGVVTSIALSMLEAKKVDAVVCIAGEHDSWATPGAIVAKSAEQILRGRGVKPSLAPSLKVLDEIKQDRSIRRLLFCGVGCSVQAFRAIQDDLGLDEVYVLGTNCVDNSPTPKAAENFVRVGLGLKVTEEVKGYEFMQDFRVHAKTGDGYLTKPYFCLPGVIAKPSIATSCLACFDYTNGLADVVVGYMGAPLDAGKRMDESFQTLTIRNQRGADMIETTRKCGRLSIGSTATGKGSFEDFALSTLKSDAIVQSMLGGSIMEKGLPGWLGTMLAFLLQRIGPTGINFARYSIDYHILRNYLHVVDEWGEVSAKEIVPAYAQKIVKKYLEKETMKTVLSKVLRKKQI